MIKSVEVPRSYDLHCDHKVHYSTFLAQLSATHFMCKVTVVSPLLTARVAISNLYIQVNTYIDKVRMLTVCVPTLESFLIYHIQFG